MLVIIYALNYALMHCGADILNLMLHRKMKILWELQTLATELHFWGENINNNVTLFNVLMLNCAYLLLIKVIFSTKSDGTQCAVNYARS